jgi:hypothetical protein
MDEVLAWHFLPDDGRLRYGTCEVVRAGETYSCDGPIVMCENGMHGSEDIMDALEYAPGAICCRVEIWGDKERGGDKLVGRYRRVLWMVDATQVLHEFACRCAEHALSRHGNGDERSWAAIAAKRAWLREEITDGELAAARDAARVAAWAAAEDAAWAAEAAARAAASAARAAAWAAQGRLLRSMIGGANGRA